MSAAWCRVTLTMDPADTDAVAALVVEHTGNGVEEPSGGVLRTMMSGESAARALSEYVNRRYPVAVEYEITPAVDWSQHWRDGIVSRQFGRLWLTPSWLPVQPAADEVVVVIDPQSAFGSGEHGSTRGALTLLERHVRAGDRVLDLGSGSGILSIAAVRLGALYAVGVEVDDGSIPIADANATQNGVDDRVRFILGDADVVAPLAGPANMICSNILRSVNTRLAPMVSRLLVPGGMAIFSGMEEPEEPLFRPVLDEAGFEAFDEARDAGWWSVAARRA